MEGQPKSKFDLDRMDSLEVNGGMTRRLGLKIAKVVSRGRYIPTLTSIGLRTCMRMKPSPISIPTIISGQAICPPTIPLDSIAIRLA